jgi:hypothetical protein
MDKSVLRLEHRRVADARRYAARQVPSQGIHMKATIAVVASFVALLAPIHAFGQPAGVCPRTMADDKFFGAWRPGWYGGEGLAVTLSDHDGRWTSPVREKLFWWSSGYRLGTEASLKIEIRNLTRGQMTASVSAPTNAYLGELARDIESKGEAILYKTTGSFEDDKWVMLALVEIPDPGCWEITGEYFGQKLTFVVETVAPRPGSERAANH